MSFRNHVSNLVKRATDEIHELKFGDRAQSSKRRAESGPDNGRLIYRRVNDSFASETVYEAVRDLKRAAVNCNVFAKTKYRGVTLHLFPDSLSNCFELSELRHADLMP